jgi:hypothetical protein
LRIEVRGAANQKERYMRKVAIGCGIGAALLTLAFGVGSYLVISKAKQFMGGYTQLAEIPALNGQILNQAAYVPPEDGRLEATQVERYMAVQRGMHDRLGERFKQLNEKYSQLSRDLEQKGREASLGQSLGALNDLMSVLMDAKRAQVAALNTAGLSYGEYQWIRQQTLVALGQGLVGLNLEALAGDPSKMANALAVPAAADAQVLEQNRALLAPYEATMDEWLPLSFFGL